MQGSRLDVNKGELKIGQYVDVDFMIGDVTISRSHAQLRWDKEKKDLRIPDNDSFNGVFVNDISLTSLAPVSLKNGDEIFISKNDDIYHTWVYYRNEQEHKPDSLEYTNISNDSSQISETQQFQLDHIVKEKDELNIRVGEYEQTRQKLAVEINELAQRVVDVKEKLLENQEKERNTFEQKVLTSRKETIAQQIKLFEDNLAEEKDLQEEIQKR